MKNVTISFIFIVTLAGLRLVAQEAIILDGFFGVPEAKQVQLRWVISSGQTCNGTFIERSTDTIHWNPIGDIPGICGSSSAPVPYTFIDESPVNNTVNFYRLELGGQGYSPFIGVPYYDYTQEGFVIIPNPAHEATTLYFSTSTTEEYTVSLFDMIGKKVQQYSGKGESQRLDVSLLPAGSFIFLISRQGKKNVSGKLIIR